MQCGNSAIVTVLHLTSDADDLTVAVNLLHAGKLVALPTETVSC